MSVAMRHDATMLYLWQNNMAPRDGANILPCSNTSLSTEMAIIRSAEKAVYQNLVVGKMDQDQRIARRVCSDFTTTTCTSHEFSYMPA